jgi:hypothetical protein
MRFRGFGRRRDGAPRDVPGRAEGSRLRRAHYRPVAEDLEGRQLLAASPLRSIPPIGTVDLITQSGPRVFSLTLNPRLGRAVITFITVGSSIDPNSLGNITLTRVGTDRVIPLNLSFLATQQNGIPTSYGPPPGPAGLNQTVMAVYNLGIPLPRGKYVLRIPSGGVRDLAGRPLDGEFFGPLPSGDGVPGTDFVAVLPTSGIYTFLPRPPGGFFSPGHTTPRLFR